MAALQQLLSDEVRVQRDGAVVVVPSHELVPGDLIFLTAVCTSFSGRCGSGRPLNGRRPSDQRQRERRLLAQSR